MRLQQKAFPQTHRDGTREDGNRMKRDTIRIPSGTISVLRWDEAGPDAPLLHFAHATGVNAQTYRKLLASLAGDFRIIAWDARGHGFTRLPADPASLVTWRTYAEDLEAMIEAIGERPFLVGHSMGGSVSFSVAATRPDLVRGIAMVEPAIVSASRSRQVDADRERGIQPNSELAEMAGRRRAAWASREEIHAKYLGRGVFAGWEEGGVGDYLDGGLLPAADGGVELACHPQWERATFLAVSTEPWRLAGSFTGEVSILRGTINTTFSAEDAVTFRELAPQARIAVAEGREHFMPLQERPLVEDFIRTAIRQTLRA